MASRPSPLRVLVPFAVTETKRDRPLGSACCCVFGYRLGLRYPVGAYPPQPCPALHREDGCGYTALHSAAKYGNCRIVRLLIAFNADVDTQDFNGCASFRFDRRDGRPSPRRFPCRNTPLHWAAHNDEPDAVAELLTHGADGAVQDNKGYRCVAQPNRNGQQTSARRRTPKQVAEKRGELAQYEAAEAQVQVPGQ